MEIQEDDVLLRVRVQPKASRDAITVEPDGRIRVALTAPPVDGAANKALLLYVARFFGLRRAQVVLRSGERSRDKTLQLKNSKLADVEERLKESRR